MTLLTVASNNSPGAHTIFCNLNTSLPLSVKSISQTAISQPLSCRPTLAPSARPTIWCPKQAARIRTRSCAKTSCRNSSNRLIHGSSSYGLNSVSFRFVHQYVRCAVMIVGTRTRPGEKDGINILQLGIFLAAIDIPSGDI